MSQGHSREEPQSGWVRDKKRRSLIRLGVEAGMAYAWSRTRMGGWRVATSPILRTTITVERLVQRGYMNVLEYYHQRKSH
jgi:phosphohistidine phosphatase SixA